MSAAAWECRRCASASTTPGSRWRWAAHVLDATRLPAATKRYLVDVGLPTGCTSRSFVFDVRLSELPCAPGSPSLRIIGAVEGTALCVDEAEQGRVLLHPSGHLVNKTVAALGDCLVECMRYEEVELDPVNRDFGLVDELETRLCRIDGEAYNEGYWGQLIDAFRTF